jgi:hypothetical protein
MQLWCCLSFSWLILVVLPAWQSSGVRLLQSWCFLACIVCCNSHSHTHTAGGRSPDSLRSPTTRPAAEIGVKAIEVFVLAADLDGFQCFCTVFAAC